MIECDENFNIGDDIEFNNVIEEETYNKEDLDKLKAKSSKKSKVSNVSNVSKPISSKKSILISRKTSSILSKANSLTESIKQISLAKPIKISKPSKPSVSFQEKVFKSKSSEKRSQSVLSVTSKTSELDKLLENVVEENDIELIEPKYILRNKSKDKDKSKDFIPPKAVKTKNSVCNVNPLAKSYYEKRNLTLKRDDYTVAEDGSRMNSRDKTMLRDLIETFLDLDKYCAVLMEEKKGYMEEKKQYEEHILSIMEKCKQDQIPHNNTVVRRDVRTMRPKPKEADIMQTLVKIFNDERMASEVTRAIHEAVPEEEKVALKKGAKKAKKQQKNKCLLK